VATKSFLLGDILTVSTGVLVTSMDGVYYILNHMTQDNLFTHQLLIASPIMRDELHRQLPFLGKVAKPVNLRTQEDCDAWIASITETYGEWHSVESAEHLWVGHTMIGDLNDIMEGKYHG
jgi:hypothetical protein